MRPVAEPAPGRESREPGKRRFALLALLAVLAAVFAGLGIWQVERRAWKLDLIARVDARVHADPVPAPGPAEWAGVDAARDEYRRVSLQGRYVPGPATLTKAVTERGPGFWLLMPFRDLRGFTVLVNRGFVAEDASERLRASAPALPIAGSVTGLLRLSEPDGGFLRSNDPANGRWYSRDVAAIAQARGLGEVAPYFVDADAVSEPGPSPRGGMTVIAFRNTHLVYALTWFALMAMSLWALVFVLRGRRSGP
jgi:surfeit locus 1 family protein